VTLDCTADIGAKGSGRVGFQHALLDLQPCFIALSLASQEKTDGVDPSRAESSSLTLQHVALRISVNFRPRRSETEWEM